MTDMFLINLPWADMQVPYCAPAILKGIADSAGYVIKTQDFNVDFRHTVCASQKEFEDLQEYFLTDDNSFNPQIDKLYQLIINRIKEVDARYLGISVFSVYTHKSTLELCRRIRQQMPECKIVVGGKGLNAFSHYSILPELSTSERLEMFGRILKRKQLVDYTIIGDAEDAIIELLSGKLTGDGFDWHAPKSSNLEYPFSNYDDYQLDKYSGIMGRPQLVVVSSKGCVRDCDFCDVAVQFARFQSKDGKRLAEEMIYLANKHNVYELATADSILNGNIKELKKTLEVLAEYNDNSAEDKKIKWGGNWICRPRMSIKPDFFKLMKKAGCTHLTVGAESGSDRVLEIMRKKTTVDGLYYELEQMEQNGIQCMINHVIAHWSETYNDFVDHIIMTIKLCEWYAKNVVTSMMLGGGFHTLRDTPAVNNKEFNNLVTAEDNYSFVWYTPNNPSLTIKARMARLLTIYSICSDYNVVMINGYSDLLSAKNRMISTFEQGKELIERLRPSDVQKCPSISLLDNYQELVEKQIQTTYKTGKIQLTVEASNGPKLNITYGDKVLYDYTLPDGITDIELGFELDYTPGAELSLAMTNKGPNDTLVGADGEILSDKYIKFHGVKVDNIDIFKDMGFWYYSMTYIQEGVKLDRALSGFWKNSKITLPMAGPFWPGYLKTKSSGSWQVNQEDLLKVISDIKNFIDSYPY